MMTNKCTATIDIMEPPIKTLILYPDKDSVILEAEPWVNYGDSTLMELTNSPDTKAATIMNFSGLSTIKDKVWKNLIDVNLKFRTSGYRTDDHTLDMYRYNDDNWQEIFVSWNNAPEKQSKIKTLDIPANKDSYQIDITDLVTKERRNDDNIGFYFSSRDEANKKIVSMYSKESTHKPYIIFRYYDIPGAPFLKNFPGEVNVAALVFNSNNPYYVGHGEINGTIELKADYVYQDITGDLYVPKFVAVHEVFKDKEGNVLGENSPANAPTEVKNQFWRDWSEASADWDIEINGTVRSARKGPAGWISGEVTPWFGSAFKNIYFDTSKVIMYSGIERANIKAMETKFSTTPDAFSKIDSEGDLLTGTVSLQGIKRVEIYGDMAVDVPVENTPEIIGSLSSAVSTSDADMPVIDCPGTIVYKQDDSGQNVIDEEKSCYLKVDGHVEGPKFDGEITVPKFFAVGTRYYQKQEETPQPSTDTLVYEEKIGDDSSKQYSGEFDYLTADAQIDGTFSMQGLQRAEIKGEVIVVYEAEPLPELSGEIGVSSLVFPVTVNPENGETTSDGDLITGTLVCMGSEFATIDGNAHVAVHYDAFELPGEVKVPSLVFPVTVNPENGETTSEGDLITGTLDFMGGEFATIDGKVHVAVHYDAFELDGNLNTVVAVDSNSLPTISCPINSNIVFKKDTDGNNLPIVDEEATKGDYLLILAQANEVIVTEDNKLEGKHDITGTVRVSYQSAFEWAFTKTDDTSQSVSSIDEIKDLYNDYESDHTKYSKISSTGDLLTGELHVMAFGRIEMETPSDNVVFTKDKDGKDTIHVDESKSGDYLFVIGLCGATTGYDKDGNRIKDYDLYDKDSPLDHTDFDKPNQEIHGRIRITAKITTWIDGSVRHVCEKIEDLTGKADVMGTKLIDLDGQIEVDAKPPQGSYAFII